VKTETGLGYKSSQVQVQVQQNGLKSGLESKSGLDTTSLIQACITGLFFFRARIYVLVYRTSSVRNTNTDRSV